MRVTSVGAVDERIYLQHFPYCNPETIPKPPQPKHEHAAIPSKIGALGVCIRPYLTNTC